MTVKMKMEMERVMLMVTGVSMGVFRQGRGVRKGWSTLEFDALCWTMQEGEVRQLSSEVGTVGKRLRG